MLKKQIPIANDGKSPMYVLGAAIMPGETRLFDEADVPVYLRPAAAPVGETKQEPLDPIAELLKGSVRVVAEQLSALSDENLGKVAALEQDGQNRKSLLAAVTEESLRRANDRQQALEEAAKLAAAADHSNAASTSTGQTAAGGTSDGQVGTGTATEGQGS